MYQNAMQLGFETKTDARGEREIQKLIQVPRVIHLFKINAKNQRF